MNIVLFEQPLLSGWVYPCTLADVQQCLRTLPSRDIEGLWSVGLAAATRGDCQANGRYLSGARPSIHLYAYPDDLSFKLPPHTKAAEIVRGLTVEQEFGMTVERVGSRYFCRWEAEALRRFICGHVLLHEVGHHICRRDRLRQGLDPLQIRRASEQFAEAYALRHRLRLPIGNQPFPSQTNTKGRA